MNELNQQELKNLLEYDGKTGFFIWINPKQGIKLGRIAGTTDHYGYRLITINGVSYKAHRLAFLYMAGKFPKEHVDHKNGIKNDNRWINLREASASQNAVNRKKPKTNTSGLKGCHQIKSSGKWRAQISWKDKSLHIGCFDDEESAHSAYCLKMDELFGEFANYG